MNFPCNWNVRQENCWAIGIQNKTIVKVGPPVHNYEHEAGSYGDGFT